MKDFFITVGLCCVAILASAQTSEDFLRARVAAEIKSLGSQGYKSCAFDGADFHGNTYYVCKRQTVNGVVKFATSTHSFGIAKEPKKPNKKEEPMT